VGNYSNLSRNGTTNMQLEFVPNMKSQEQFKAEIDAMLNNFDWETNPKWYKTSKEIQRAIWQYWEIVLEAEYDYKTQQWKRE
jgi:hypothetical protein